MNSPNPRVDPPVLGLATLPMAHGNATLAERQVSGTGPGTAQRSADAVADAARWDTLQKLAPLTPT